MQSTQQMSMTNVIYVCNRNRSHVEHFVSEMDGTDHYEIQRMFVNRRSAMKNVPIYTELHVMQKYGIKFVHPVFDLCEKSVRILFGYT